MQSLAKTNFFQNIVTRKTNAKTTNTSQQKDSTNIKTDKQLQKDEFVAKYKKIQKISLISTLAITTGYIAFSAIKKPQQTKEFFFDLLNEIKATKNKIKFDDTKIFDGKIDADSMYKKGAQMVKDVELDLFDEKTITDKDLAQKLQDFGLSNSFYSESVENLRNDPKKMRLFNIMSNFKDEKGDGLRFYKLDYYGFRNTKCSIDEIETYFKMCKKAQEEGGYISNSNADFKNFITLAGLKKEIFDRCGLKMRFQDNIVRDIPKAISNDIDGFLDFVSSLKKGTVLNKHYSLFDIHSLPDEANFRAGKRFYENLQSANRQDILKKLSADEIMQLTNHKNKKSIEVFNILVNAPKDVIKKLGTFDISTYVDYHQFWGVDNINQLDIQAKKALLQQLISSNSSTFGNGKKISTILPSNQEEYCKLLDKLAKSIGVDVKPLSKAEHATFEKGIKGIANSIQNVDLNRATFDLDFSRADFVKQIQEKLSGLSKKEQAQVMDYFGFEIKDGILKGYPINVNNGEKLSEITTTKAQSVVEDIRPLVQKFSVDNKVKIKGASREFNDSVNEILKGLPELRPMFKKAQHGTHAFTLDVHTFKVLQEVCSNPKFQKLSDDDKKVLEIASLLHDITKTEGMRDSLHPIESAFDTYYIIQKLGLPESQQLKIYELVKTHNWLQLLNNEKNPEIVENIAQDIAFDSRHTNTFELAKILCEADLKSVKKDDSFFKHFKPTLDEMSAKVDQYVQKLHNTQIALPQTQIPKASAIKNGVQKTHEGITNTVIYMDDLDDDLSKYGFAQGTTKQNWTALVHALEHPEQMGKFDTFSVIDNEALLSTSFINPQEYKVFRKQGLILDVNTNDIHAGYECDFGTGCTKSYL